jgi:alcohol dehydrogenase (cytochrome c)
MVWSQALVKGTQQGTPLVYEGIMYMPNPQNVIRARNAVTGEPIWEYRRELPQDLPSIIRDPARTRNQAIYGNLIIASSGDDFVYAVDATSGKLVWETQILDFRINPALQSSGPIIADGKVLSGRNCFSEGGPEACVITAHDARTGRELWRTRTIPKPGEPGDESWADVPFERRWHVGTWMVPSYDPELRLVYVGTSVTSPAPKFMLGSNDHQYLYHNSTLALDIDTGEMVWYYQHVVDHWDLDHPFERILIDTIVAPDPEKVSWINPNLRPGERRQVVTGIPGKTGIVYTLDRKTGEFLWARPTVTQNVVDHIEGATGKVTVNPEVIFTATGQQRLVCPNTSGGKNWPPGAYSPQTHAMYFPLQNTCMSMTTSEMGPTFDFLDSPGTIQKSRYGFRGYAQIAPGTRNVGRIEAISVETGETLWKYEQRAGVTALLTTGGGLVFGGDAAGFFRALDQDTGEVLWEVDLGSGVTGHPVTYAVDGRQYVAVSTGVSVMTGIVNNLTPELSTGVDNTLFVFALP